MSDDTLKHDVEALAGELVAWRRAIHRNPELGFEEHETSRLVADELGKLDLELHTGVARTGVVAIVRAAKPTGPAVLLRADMDALPVQEVEGREYGSQIPNRMHARASARCSGRFGSSRFQSQTRKVVSLGVWTSATSTP